MTPADRKALARLRREEDLQALRDGRRRRAVRIDSAKAYRRKPKHRSKAPHAL